MRRFLVSCLKQKVPHKKGIVARSANKDHLLVLCNDDAKDDREGRLFCNSFL